MALRSTIEFTDDHVQKIEDGEKTSTLRTIKEKHFYPVGKQVQVNGTGGPVIEIVERVPVYLTENGLRKLDLDKGTSLDREEVVETEGFDSWEELFSWFDSKNYRIPRAMWLYRFTKVE